jgi:hypothetical protein
VSAWPSHPRSPFVRTGPRERQRAATRERLYEAALAEFRSKGRFGLAPLQESRLDQKAAVYQRCCRHHGLERRDRQAMAEGDVMRARRAVGSNQRLSACTLGLVGFGRSAGESIAAGNSRRRASAHLWTHTSEPIGMRLVFQT